jgi:SAM-dependent methyltransferase
MQGEAFVWHVHNVFEAYRRHLRGRRDDFAGLRILEIGPGEHLGIPLLFVAAGAREVACVDHTREVRNDAPEVRRMYEGLRSRIDGAGARARFDGALAGLRDCEKPGAQPIAYRPHLPLEDATPDLIGRFDLIVSMSVLEHVRAPRAAMGRMYECLQPGGWMAHCVDLASHDRYESYPLEFLEVGERLWDLQFSNLGGPNRLRIGDYRRLLDETGFTEVYLFADRTFSERDVARMGTT